MTRQKASKSWARKKPKAVKVRRKPKAAKVMVVKKKEAHHEEPVPAPAPVVKPTERREGLCECGKPVAAGQTYVCKDHIRST
jgi:hypothetical protein